MPDWQAIYHRFWTRAIQGGPVALHKKTQITIETDQVLIIRRQCVGKAWCRVCEQEVDVVRTDQARGLLGSATDAAGQPTRRWHFCQDAEGSALICLNSLMHWSGDHERK